ncbi:MAG: hypothetical protein HC842_05790, partial [Cytophagales bacterium]|nr:hypothetical protein [Cytophagales bacterium]
GFTGTGYVDYGGQNSYAQWTVNATTAGSHTFQIPLRQWLGRQPPM